MTTPSTIIDPPSSPIISNPDDVPVGNPSGKKTKKMPEHIILAPVLSPNPKDPSAEETLDGDDIEEEVEEGASPSPMDTPSNGPARNEHWGREGENGKDTSIDPHNRSASPAPSSESMVPSSSSLAPSMVSTGSGAIRDVGLQELVDAGPSGLDLLLNSNIPLAYFLLFLLEEYSCENLFCYLEIEHFQVMSIAAGKKSMDPCDRDSGLDDPYHDPMFKAQAAETLARTYLTSDRGFEVNLPQGIQDRCLRAVTEARKRGQDVSVSAFDEVKLSARRLMADSYRRFFQTSRVWKLMEHDLGLECAKDTLERRVKIVQELRTWLRTTTSPGTERSRTTWELTEELCCALAMEDPSEASVHPPSSPSASSLSSTSSPSSRNASMDIPVDFGGRGRPKKGVSQGSPSIRSHINQDRSVSPSMQLIKRGMSKIKIPWKRSGRSVMNKSSSQA
ncbi:hypothetical protein BJ684DRAFT_21365 [Piptocephalis cylindrospora]|uniref:RGS domain-containing protein n=1 Tax=Piptocephalis cylindrospora TaxID=1907219 RepID=A0A4P9Y1Z7_9FUNG|nr:hypothetical protein BJ684DRAFT_21365 [Piptocephalis cylindrospora]|eukprot:RKP12071.1 hypothetical protein BJ684DRAFT_21365 [Piptocephalis cylindrospora]